MPQTITGTLRGKVITLDVHPSILGTGRSERAQRVRLALEILRPRPRSPILGEEVRRENLKRLAQINAAVSEGPDPEEKELRKRMRRLLSQRDIDG